MRLLSSLNVHIEMLAAKLYLGHSMTLLPVTLTQMSSDFFYQQSHLSASTKKAYLEG